MNVSQMQCTVCFKSRKQYIKYLKTKNVFGCLNNVTIELKNEPVCSLSFCWHFCVITSKTQHSILATSNTQFGPRDGACHANHACAALTVSRSCRQWFVFFHWKCTQVLQKSLSLIIKQACFKRYHPELLRHLVAFSKFEWFMSSDPKIKNFSTHFVHKP